MLQKTDSIKEKHRYLQTNLYISLRRFVQKFEPNDSLTLFGMGLFRAAQGGGGAFWSTLPKIHDTYPTMMKLGTVIPYLRKIQKMYKSRDTFLEFC